jgi:hypothetical protein
MATCNETPATSWPHAIDAGPSGEVIHRAQCTEIPLTGGVKATTVPTVAPIASVSSVPLTHR